MFLPVDTFMCSYTNETHQGRTQQMKQEAGLEAWLST
jgi:hypothetical protein